MKPSRQFLPRTLAVGMLLGVLAWGVCAPAAAAGCGDHLVPRAGRAAPGPAPRLRTPSHAPPSFDRDPVPHDRGPGPCRGPHCSAPTAPEQPTPPAPVQAPADWAILASPFCVPSPDPRVNLTADVPGGFGRHPSSVYRPPRV